MPVSRRFTQVTDKTTTRLNMYDFMIDREMFFVLFILAPSRYSEVRADTAVVVKINIPIHTYLCVRFVTSTAVTVNVALFWAWDAVWSGSICREKLFASIFRLA
jgi:hypothetical protein